MTRFPMTWDRTLRIVTPLASLLLVGVPAFVALRLVRAPDVPRPVIAAMIGLCVIASALTLVLSWALAPRALTLAGPALRVERPLRPVVVPFAEMSAVTELPPGALRGALRLAGNGGLFGYYGSYRSGALGVFRLYATRRDRLVALDTRGGRFVVSVDDPAALAEALLARSPATRHPAGALPPPAATGWRPFLPLVAVLALGLIALGAALLASR